MNTKEKVIRIAALESELASLKSQVEREQSVCKHQWGETYLHPEEFTEFVPTGKNIGMGSDYWPETKAITKLQNRWARTCSGCGKTEYTKKQKPTGMVADFS